MIETLLSKHFIIAILGLMGFFIASSMYSLKKKSAASIDNSTSKCLPVITSEYSRFLGGAVERIGMIYYSFIFVSYFYLAFMRTPLPEYLVLLLDIYAITAFGFSLYLLYVQFFVLKKVCSWCVGSSFICIVIFVLNFFIYKM